MRPVSRRYHDPVRIVTVASECEPFAKTGGLGDVVDSLARSLGRLGHEVDVFLPLYRGLTPPGRVERRTVPVPTAGVAAVVRGSRSRAVDIVTGDAVGYRIRLVDAPDLFDRAGIYGDQAGDYPDNGARFATLGRAAIETVCAEGVAPDVLHGHDWQGAPALLSLRSRYVDHPVVAGTACVLTCHNLAFHGRVPGPAAGALDLRGVARASEGVDLLREAVIRADLVNTVSPTHAAESRRPESGFGLDDVLRARGDRYLGILNGIDTELWDPAADATLAAPYSAGDPLGKAACRRDLAERLGLDPGEDSPILAAVGRADWQKGMDLISVVGGDLVAAGARLVVLSTGDERQLDGLRSVVATHPRRAILCDRFDRALARQIYAGSDLLLMPSRFEPCGLSQLIGLRYGSLPLVRRTGGLADTVIDADEDPARGNGFVFDAPEPGALLAAGRRAMAAFGDRLRWRVLVARAMAADFSWDRSVREYVALFERAIAIRRERG